MPTHILGSRLVSASTPTAAFRHSNAWALATGCCSIDHVNYRVVLVHDQGAECDTNSNKIYLILTSLKEHQCVLLLHLSALPCSSLDSAFSPL